jgi:hypothetical protein
MEENKSALEKLEGHLKNEWRKKGHASVIAAKHAEFTVEPKVFLGDKLNPDILKLLVASYLARTARQDSGTGANIEVTPEKLIIKTPKGRPLVIVSDQKLIQQYLAARR